MALACLSKFSGRPNEAQCTIPQESFYLMTSRWWLGGILIFTWTLGKASVSSATFQETVKAFYFLSNQQPKQSVFWKLNAQILKVRWTWGYQGKLRHSPTWLVAARIKGSLEWVQYHSPGMEVRYLAFPWLPMISNTTDKLRSRHTAVLKAPACPQEIPRESRHLPQARSCPHLEECLLTWGWITYNNV